MKLTIAALLALASLLLAGCGSPPLQRPEAPPPQLFADALFTPPAQAIDATRVFALSPEMREYLQRVILPASRRVGAQQALLEALYTNGQLKLDYDATRTRNAAEAFEARSGNCLSLLIMTGAFANEMGLHVRYQSVLHEEAWERSDDLHFFIGHVNIRLGGFGRHTFATGGQDWMTIDFLPGQDLTRQRTREIDQPRVLAMYMNNRGAEALARGDLDEAYAWLREGLRHDPGYLAAYNTLGVVYLRRGALREAEAALRHVQALDRDNPHVLGNLTIVMRKAGRDDEAQALLARLRHVQPEPPFALFREGQQAMRAGEYRRAQRLFEREIARAPEYHEFHFWLALAHLQLGEQRAARDALELALKTSTTREQQGLYAAKLQRLKRPL